MSLLVLVTTAVLLLVLPAATARDIDCYGASVKVRLVPPPENKIAAAVNHGSPVFGYPAAFGDPINATESAPFKLAIPSPVDACATVQPPPAEFSSTNSTNFCALVQRGNCTFEAKARALMAAGFRCMLLYTPGSDACIVMGGNETTLAELVGIVAGGITATAAAVLEQVTAAGGSVALSQPPQSRFDASEGVLWVLAVGIISVGSVWATAAHTAGGAAGGRPRIGIEEEGDGADITVRAAAAFVFAASAGLLLMFLLLSKWLVLVLCGLFAVIGAQSTTLVLFSLLHATSPPAWRSICIRLPCAFNPAPLLEVIAAGTAAVASALWIILQPTHWDWPLQDLLGVCLCLVFLKSVRLPNLKVAAILLLSAAVYDVWWVFLQPIVVGGPSVMVEVASAGAAAGLKMPMLLAVPRWMGLGTNPSYSMLGLGDILLPGLLVVMARRWDAATGRSKDSSYFFPLVVAYAGGLMLTFCALAFGWGGDQGQPALIYLVPCTMGALCLLGWARGELAALWLWDEGEDKAGEARDEEGGVDAEESPLLAPGTP